jgi:membrane protein YdbS with pleckstrin-like domain
MEHNNNQDTVRSDIRAVHIGVNLLLAVALSVLTFFPKGEPDLAKVIIGAPSWVLPWTYLGMIVLFVICGFQKELEGAALRSAFFLAIAVGMNIFAPFLPEKWYWWYGLAAGGVISMIIDLFWSAYMRNGIYVPR